MKRIEDVERWRTSGDAVEVSRCVVPINYHVMDGTMTSDLAPALDTRPTSIGISYQEKILFATPGLTNLASSLHDSAISSEKLEPDPRASAPCSIGQRRKE